MTLIPLDYSEIHEKQEFSALDINELRVKRCDLFHM